MGAAAGTSRSFTQIHNVDYAITQPLCLTTERVHCEVCEENSRLPALESSPGLTVRCGSPSWWSVQLGRCGAGGGVAVAPEQAVFALAVCVGGDAGDVALSVSDEEGAA